jgi:hypothetical protein
VSLEHAKETEIRPAADELRRNRSLSSEQCGSAKQNSESETNARHEIAQKGGITAEFISAKSIKDLKAR